MSRPPLGRAEPPWPRAADVAARRAAGWQPFPLDSFVLKVHSRCDLACDYCYMYRSHDQSWRAQPRTMTPATLTRTAERIAEHLSAHGVTEAGVVLHGGEPLLIGDEALARTVRTLRAAVGDGVRLHLSLQTNGLRLTEQRLDLLGELEVTVGVSTDGGRAAHDRHRRGADGRGSHAGSRPPCAAWAVSATAVCSARCSARSTCATTRSALTRPCYPQSPGRRLPSPAGQLADPAARGGPARPAYSVRGLAVGGLRALVRRPDQGDLGPVPRQPPRPAARRHPAHRGTRPVLGAVRGGRHGRLPHPGRHPAHRVRRRHPHRPLHPPRLRRHVSGSTPASRPASGAPPPFPPPAEPALCTGCAEAATTPPATTAPRASPTRACTAPT